jgi:tetratricopeptide (TPR) repeat protein
MATELEDQRNRLTELSYDDTAVTAVFDLSYQHLTSEQGRLFRLLSANPGPDISTTATAALTGQPETDTRRGLEALARAHLIEASSAYGRWRMHDLVRLYADQHSRTRTGPDGRDEAFTRLLDHYLAATRAADAHLNPTVADPASRGIPDRQQALAWLDAEYPNLTAAVHTAADRHPDIAVDLPLELAHFLDWRRLFNDWITLTRIGLATAQRFEDQHRQAGALRNLGGALQRARRSEEAIVANQQAAAIYRELGDQRSEAMVLNNLGLALQAVRRFDEAITAHEQAAVIYRELSDWYGEGTAINNLGLALRHLAAGPGRGHLPRAAVPGW